MLRFNTEGILRLLSHQVFQYILCYGSTDVQFFFYSRISQFQYILCYGSTVIITAAPCRHINFNTSYVTVQRRIYQVSSKRNTISIHPMLRFNIKSLKSKKKDSTISIHPMLRFNSNSSLFAFLIV